MFDIYKGFFLKIVKIAYFLIYINKIHYWLFFFFFLLYISNNRRTFATAKQK